MPALPLGGFQIRIIREAIYHWDGGAFFGVVPKTLWSEKLPSDELNRVRVSFNCYLVETGDHTILIETGGTGKTNERARERMGIGYTPPPLPELIAAKGIDPERIDIVLNTHLHWDHCSWNTIVTGGQAKPAFPLAKYYTRRGEWEHAHERHPRDSVSYIDLNYDPLIDSGQMRLIDEDCEVVPGIRMSIAPGHNRDTMVVTVQSGAATFCFFSDLVPTTAHLAPTWIAAFDLSPVQAIDTKLEWLSRAARENWICGFGHDATVDFARISAHQGRFALAEVLDPALAAS
jgi:glyoxylase-like metal-dependent hydrolase (beta-lactamase superfamily II)